MDDFEKVEDRQSFRILSFFVLIEDLADEEPIGRHASCSLNHPVARLFGFTHVHEGGAQHELPGVTVPIAPGAEESDVLLDLEKLTGREIWRESEIQREIGTVEIGTMGPLVVWVVGLELSLDSSKGDVDDMNRGGD